MVYNIKKEIRDKMEYRYGSHKGRSSRKLFEIFPELRKKYWGKHFWARGYFCVTSGEVTEEMIMNYIENHFEPKGDANFGVNGS